MAEWLVENNFCHIRLWAAPAAVLMLRIKLMVSHAEAKNRIIVKLRRFLQMLLKLMKAAA